MALSQSALNVLLEAIRAGDGTDILHDAMRIVPALGHPNSSAPAKRGVANTKA